MARSYRFFLRHTEILKEEGHTVYEKVEPEIFFQLTKVLRVKPGDGVCLLVSSEQAPFFEYHYQIEDISRQHVSLQFVKKTVNDHELDFQLGLILCLPNKPDKLEFMIQKAVELGVQKIQLVEGDFSQMKHHLKEERLRKIMIEAAEQSERGLIPQLFLEGKLQTFLESKTDPQSIWVAMERLATADGALKNFWQSEKKSSLSLLIGPEGGLSEKEKELIHRLKLPCFSLGKQILRMETAVILSLGLASLRDS